MVLMGFADLDMPLGMVRERPFGEAEHIAWSVPPQAVAGLADRLDEWPSDADGKPRDE